MNSKTKNIIAWILAGLVSLVFVGSGFMKLTNAPAEMVKMLGGQSNVTLLGALELVMVVLFLIPRTGIVGSLLMIAYMGGAMAVHLTSGQGIMVQTIIQIAIWLVAAYRFPELTKRLFNHEK